MKKMCLVSLITFIIFLALITIGFLNFKENKNLKDSSQKYETSEKVDETEENLNTSESIESFDLDEYQDEIEHLLVNLKYEEINDAETAIEVAKKAWADYLSVKYPPESYTGLDKIKQIKVYYDSTNDCWLLMGLYYNDEDIDRGSVIIGGPALIVKSSGETIAIWFSR